MDLQEQLQRAFVELGLARPGLGVEPKTTDKAISLARGAIYAAQQALAAPQPSQGVEREAYIADLIDTFEQLRQILGTPEQDADALIAASRRLASESVAVSGEVSRLSDATDRDLRQVLKGAVEMGWIGAEQVQEITAVLALAGSGGKEAAALERMARLDDEMGIEP